MSEEEHLVKRVPGHNVDSLLKRPALCTVVTSLAAFLCLGLVLVVLDGLTTTHRSAAYLRVVPRTLVTAESLQTSASQRAIVPVRAKVPAVNVESAVNKQTVTLQRTSGAPLSEPALEISRSQVVRGALVTGGLIGLNSLPGVAWAVAPQASCLPEASKFMLQLSLMQTDKTTKIPTEFAIYLTGYLIRADSEWRAWWRAQVNEIPKLLRASYRSNAGTARERIIKDRYSKATMELRGKLEQTDIEALCSYLYQEYGTQPSLFRRHHLAILFALLEATEQPRALIVKSLQNEFRLQGKIYRTQQILKVFQGGERINVDNYSERGFVSFLDGFFAPQLLPINLYPLFDVTRRRWVVPDSPEMYPDEGSSGNARGAFFLGKEDIDSDTSELKLQSLAFSWYTASILSSSGALSNGITNVIVQPLDVIKTSMQTTGGSLPQAFSRILQQRGPQGLMLGGGASFWGNFLYGAIIFPLFELGKIYFTGIIGEDFVAEYRFPFVLVVSAMATVIGAVVLVPFEAVKIKTISNPLKYAKRDAREISANSFEEGDPSVNPKANPYVQFEEALNITYSANNEGQSSSTLSSLSSSDSFPEHYISLSHDSSPMEALSTIKWFSLLDPDAKQMLATKLERRTFREGDVIQKEGYPSTMAHIFLAGKAEVRCQASGYMFDTQAGDCLGLLHLVSNEDPSHHTITATSDVEVYEIPSEGFDSVVARNPKAAKAFMAALAKQVRAYQKIEIEQIEHANHLEHEESAYPPVKSMPEVFMQVIEEEGVRSFWAGYFVLLARAMTYNFGRFSVFELVSDGIGGISAGPLYTLLKGSMAGVAAALCSQPADTVLTRANKDEKKISIPEAAKQLFKEAGPLGLYQGAPPRLIWCVILVTMQFIIYEKSRIYFFDQLMTGIY